MDASKVFNLSADHVALDFVNTLDDRFAESQTETLGCYNDLLRFATQSKILTASQAASLANTVKESDAAAALKTGVELRELLARIFYPIALGRCVAPRDLAAFNESFGRTIGHRVLSDRTGDFVWHWEGLDSRPQAPLWPVLQQAADLLVSPNLKFVRACARESCRWLFLDVSKNHSRRWCDMKLCGNRVKANRYYALHGRANEADESS